MRKHYVVFLIITSISIITIITFLAFFFEYPFTKNIDPNTYLNQYNYHLMAVLPKEKDLQWEYLKEGIKKANQDFNIVTEIFEVENAEEQLEILKMAIASDIDGIILSPMGDFENTAIIKKANEKGIPIITVLTDVPNSKRNSFLGENVKFSYLAAREYIGVTGGDANISVLSASKTSFKLKERLEGLEKAIEEYDGVKLIMTKEIEDDLLLATENIQRLLMSNPEINTIFCISPNSAIAAARAVERLDRKNILIMGYDDFPETLNYIQKGTIYGTIVQNSSFIGYVAVRYIQDIQKGKWVPEVLDTNPLLITKENVSEYKKRRGISE